MSRHIPRLGFDDLEPALAEALAPRVRRLGYLGEFFRVMGHQPAALKGFVDFTEAAKAGLDKRLVELLALTVASHFGNAYERNQHERLSVRLGYGREWIDQVERLEPEAAEGLTARERQVQRFALDSVRSHGREGAEALDGLAVELGPQVTVALLMVITRYVAHAYLVNLLGLAPPVPSIHEDGFTGDPPPAAG